MFASSATGTGSALTSTPSRSIRSPATSFRNCPRTPLICSCAHLLIVICSSGHDPRHRVPPPASASVSAFTRFASHHLPICPSFRFCFRGHQLSRLSSDRRPPTSVLSAACTASASARSRPRRRHRVPPPASATIDRRRLRVHLACSPPSWSFSSCLLPPPLPPHCQTVAAVQPLTSSSSSCCATSFGQYRPPSPRHSTVE